MSDVFQHPWIGFLWVLALSVALVGLVVALLYAILIESILLYARTNVCSFPKASRLIARMSYRLHHGLWISEQELVEVRALRLRKTHEAAALSEHLHDDPADEDEEG